MTLTYFQTECVKKTNPDSNKKKNNKITKNSILNYMTIIIGKKSY